MTTIYSNCISELRKEYHVSQEQMAKDLGISRRSIGKIEKGEQNLSLEMAYRIANYFEKLIPEVFPLLSDVSLMHCSPLQKKGSRL